jgi:hypothetical protein
MVSVIQERDRTMHTLLTATINYDIAAGRRHNFETAATRRRATRRADTARHDADIGSILPFKTVTIASSSTGHASARVA